MIRVVECLHQFFFADKDLKLSEHLRFFLNIRFHYLLYFSTLDYTVPETGLEPAHIAVPDPKSGASANFATPARTNSENSQYGYNVTAALSAKLIPKAKGHYFVVIYVHFLLPEVFSHINMGVVIKNRMRYVSNAAFAIAALTLF